ncbi:MAG: cysteine desulfurase [Pseudomonadota bacterium]
MAFTLQEIAEIRLNFPILQTQARGNPLVYLDNAATTQKPRQCIEATSRYYEMENANVHRGVHYLSEISTQKYEDARKIIADFIHAPSSSNIVFTRGTTEAINLVAHGFSRTILKPGDEIIISAMEHHSNIVPWQLACQYSGASLKVINLLEDTSLDLEHFKTLLSEKTKLVAVTYISNTLGNINPVEEIIRLSKEKNIPTLIDAAQATAHKPINVQMLACDFLVFSGHKMFGPTGIGALYGTSEWLNKLPPYQGGGDMITKVSYETSEYQKAPLKFEAGTPNIAGTLAWVESIKYLSTLDLNRIQQYEHDLLNYATEKLNTIPNIQIIGTATDKASIISFIHKNAHPHDIATILDDEGIAIRAGHHCTMPLMNYLKLNTTARASFCFYNTFEEIDLFINALKTVDRIFS